ncbi:hypothetical protein ES703_112519 [subsurface metagenome]
MALNRTPIEWVKNPDGTQGYTWNPITGCLNGCPYCYARKLANGRLKSRYLANKNLAPFPSLDYSDNPQSYPPNNPFYPRFWEDRLLQIQNAPKNSGIFVCDMSDLFGIGIPEDWTEDVLSEISLCEDCRFYLLTKQPQNLPKWSPFPSNCQVGITATNYTMLAYALEYLKGIQASVKYVSLEPMLERMNIPLLDKVFINCGIKQVIIGAQTKPTVMPKIEWVEEIEAAARKAGIAIFEKDNLRPLLSRELIQEVPNAP